MRMCHRHALTHKHTHTHTHTRGTEARSLPDPVMTTLTVLYSEGGAAGRRLRCGSVKKLGLYRRAGLNQTQNVSPQSHLSQGVSVFAHKVKPQKSCFGLTT